MALNDVPLSGQTLGVTRVPIEQNFSVIDTAFSVDHVSYNTAGQGKHNQVTFPVQAMAPVFLAGEEGLYNSAASGVSEIYVHKQIQAGTAEIPMTASTLSTTTPPNATGGWTWLPSGLYMNWGNITIIGGGLSTITIANPPANALLNVIVTPWSTAAGYVNLQVRLVNILNASQFQVFISVNGAAATGGLFFQSIGY